MAIEAENAMDGYQKYLNKLCQDLPSTYHKLCNFLKRPKCKCQDPLGSCFCQRNAGVCGCITEKGGCTCWQDSEGCKCQAVEDTVRVYEIYTKHRRGLETTVYHTSNHVEFKELQKKLYEDEPADGKSDDDDDEDSQGERDMEDNRDTYGAEFDDSHYRLITVSHINPNIAKLLGAKYDIGADFFNRHLPGTEALSGKLISRLPSSIQVEFDELYESTKRFRDLWPRTDPAKAEQDGHRHIREAMKAHYLFGHTGWDYFPVKEDDWQGSWDNSPLSSGYEVILQNPDLENVFQFNLSHRISVYSKPAKNPRTAIIIFYPTLPIYHDHSTSKPSGQPDRHLTRATAPPNQEPVGFRAIPNAVPKPSGMKDFTANSLKQHYATSFHREFELHVQTHFNKLDKKECLQTEGLDVNLAIMSENAGKEAQTIFEIAGRSTLEGERKNHQFDDTLFVHLFAAPIFRMVAANWARLIVRRSFDLDLLEWRPKDLVHSKTIDEIKSRRISIARHQKDINESLEILRGLTLEEQGQKVSKKELNPPAAPVLNLQEADSKWNRGRANGLVTQPASEDSWERIYWDYYELRAQMNALGERADKIQDGLVGLISVSETEAAGKLNHIAMAFSAILLPFSVVGTVYGANLKNPAPSQHWYFFLVALLATLLAIILAFLAYEYCQFYQDQQYHWVGKLGKKFKDKRPKFLSSPSQIPPSHSGHPNIKSLLAHKKHARMENGEVTDSSV